MTDLTKPSAPQAGEQTEAQSWPSGQGILWRRALRRWLGHAPSAGQRTFHQTCTAASPGPSRVGQREAA